MISIRRIASAAFGLTCLTVASAGAGVQELLPSAEGSGLSFGASVAASGGLALAGMPTGGNPADSGSLEVFARNGQGVVVSAGWFKAFDPEPGALFTGKVDLNGTYGVAAAIGHTTGSGVVYLLERDPLPPHTWSQERIYGPDSNLEDQFGFALAASPERLAVGAPRNWVADTRILCGAVYLFTRDGNWQYEQKLQPVAECPLAGASYDFGRAVALDGDRLAATLEPFVLIYERIGGVWQETAKIDPGPDVFGDNARFGHQLALEGNRLLVASPDNGRTYVYEKTGGVWAQVAALGTPDAAPGANFGGDAVALEGDLALVGCTGCPAGDPNLPGAAYLYQRQGDGSWLELRRFLGSETNSRFGAAIDFEGSRAWIGAPQGHGGDAAATGALYLIDVAPAVFADGFESGDTGAWTVNQGP